MSNIHGKKIFKGTATGTTQAITAQATPTSTTARNVITDIAASSDKVGAILVVKSGGTEIWQVQLSGSSTPVSHAYGFETPLICDAEKNVTIEVDGTSYSKVNISGYIIP